MHSKELTNKPRGLVMACPLHLSKKQSNKGNSPTAPSFAYVISPVLGSSLRRGLTNSHLRSRQHSAAIESSLFRQTYASEVLPLCLLTESSVAPCLVSLPDRLSSACIASPRAILKAIRAGVGWVWD